MANPQVTERVTNNSFGVADSLSFFDDRLVATVGVRYQQIKTGSYSYSDGSYDSGYSSDATTPAFALVYKPSDKVSLYANYAEALVPGKTAPNLVNSVVEGWGATPVAVTVSNGGEVLEPFRAKQAEVGVKYDVGSFGGTLSLFRTALPSELFTVTSNGNPATNERPTGDYSAGGEQENRGVELTVFGEPLEGVRVIGGATWLDAEIKRALNPALDGKSAIGVPDFQANLNVEWDVRRHRRPDAGGPGRAHRRPAGQRGQRRRTGQLDPIRRRRPLRLRGGRKAAGRCGRGSRTWRTKTSGSPSAAIRDPTI